MYFFRVHIFLRVLLLHNMCVYLYVFLLVLYIYIYIYRLLPEIKHYYYDIHQNVFSHVELRMPIGGSSFFFGAA